MTRRAKRLGPALVATATIFGFALLALLLDQRSLQSPARETFTLFPMRIDDWHGRTERLSPEIIEALKVQDYLLANFHSAPQTPRVNLYIAYYDAQNLGSSAHSPRSCIPGGGWEIESLSQTTVNGAGIALTVNRAVIAKGQIRQLVYYWFEQRGRVLASEYAVKWYLLVDGLFRRRTDGALIRIITPISSDGTDAADRRLQKFIGITYPRLGRFIPS